MSTHRSRVCARSAAGRGALWVAVLGLAAAAGAGGCGPAFDPFNRLEGLRVLAIRSDPVAPASGETATLSALVYTSPPPTGQPAPVPTYAWSWCPFVGASTSVFPCPPQVTDAVEALTGPSVSFDLGTSPTASLPNNIDPTLLSMVCDGTLAGPFPQPDCTNGFPVTIILTVTIGDGAGTNTVNVIQPLNMRFPTDSAGDTQQANNNPTISDPVATIGGVQQPLDGTGTSLPRRAETPIGVTVPDDASETYMGTDENGNPKSLLEQLVLTWFVETGDTQHQDTEFLDGVSTLADAVQNQWTPGTTKDYKPDSAELIVVIRDERNGVAWTSGTATLADSP